jgi:hypothetical protein
MINTGGLRVFLVLAEQRSLGVLIPRPPIGCYALPTDLTCHTDCGFHSVGAIHELPLQSGNRIAQTLAKSSCT